MDYLYLYLGHFIYMKCAMFFHMLDQQTYSKKIPLNLAKYAFSNKKIYQRFLIVLAGPLANFIFGIIGFALIYSLIGKIYVPPIINNVEKNSPAFIAGLIKDDEVIKIDNNKIKSFNDIGTFINLYKKKTYSFEIIRNNEIFNKNILQIYYLVCAFLITLSPNAGSVWIRPKPLFAYQIEKLKTDSGPGAVITSTKSY